MEEKEKKQRPREMPRWQWRKQLLEESINQPLEYFEEFFIDKLNEGLKLKNKKLTKENRNLLCTIFLSNPRTEPQKTINELNDLFKKYKINNAKEWNDEMVETLNEAFDEELKSYKNPEDKKIRKDFEKSLNFSFRHPKINWNEAFDDLYKHSTRIILSGIVQNWYFKYGKGRMYRWKI